MLNGLIIAGGRIGKEWADLVGTNYKCLIQIGGKPLVQYVLEALRGCEFVERIVVVGPKELKEQPLAKSIEAVIEDTGIGSENIRLGVEALGMSNKILLLPADIPLITPEALKDFISRCPEESDVCFPVLKKKTVTDLFSQRSWLLVRLREGSFTGGNMVLFNPQIFTLHADLMKKIFEARRSVWQLSKLWGLRFSLKFILQHCLRLPLLSLRDLEAHGSFILKYRCKAVVSDFWQLGLDVDRPGDLELVRRCLEVSSLKV